MKLSKLSGGGINSNEQEFFLSTQVVNEIDCSTTMQQQSRGNWRQVLWKSQVLAKQMSINDGGPTALPVIVRDETSRDEDIKPLMSHLRAVFECGHKNWDVFAFGIRYFRGC